VAKASCDPHIYATGAFESKFVCNDLADIALERAYHPMLVVKNPDFRLRPKFSRVSDNRGHATERSAKSDGVNFGTW
jgi:hypothetical protein